MAGWMKCPKCGDSIRFRCPEEMECHCGWSYCRDEDEDVFDRFGYADMDREALEDLLKDFRGDEDAMFGYLWALSKDD
jgi:hypothetical protein